MRIKDDWRGNICGPFQCYRPEDQDDTPCWDTCLGEAWPDCPHGPARREPGYRKIVGEP